MALSPVQRHIARTLAALSSASAEPGGEVTGDAYQLMMAKLVGDRRRLKDIQSIERKIEVKGELLPDYQDWIIGALSGGAGGQDTVLTTVLVWHIDVGNIGIALQIAAYALQHKLALPDQYNRNLATMLLDEVAGAYLSGKYDDLEAAVLDLSYVGLLTDAYDAPDQARAKLHKALAYAWLAIVDAADDGDIAPPVMQQAEQSIKHFHRALALFDAIGVKKDIERLERRLKKATSS